jgi:CBS domain-containing protein
MKINKEFFKDRKLIVTSSNTKVIDAAKYIAEQNVGLLPVMDNNKLVGVFSERDLIKRVLAKNLDINSTQVGDVMTKNLVLAAVNETYQSCLKKMQDARIRHILIVEGDELIGVLSMRDLLAIDISVQKETIEVLNNYIYSR